MCGIAGLFIKDDGLEPELGRLLAGMLHPLCDRGPDSAGFAVYGRETSGAIKLTLRAPAGFDFKALLRELATAGSPTAHQIHDTHMVITVPLDSEAVIRARLAEEPEVAIVGMGRRMAIFK